MIFITLTYKDVQLDTHQRRSVELIKKYPGVGIFLGAGTGKTLTVLKALEEMQFNQHVLIIAPNTIAKTTWQQEIEKWKFPFRVKNYAANKNGNNHSIKKRHKLYQEPLNEPPTVYIISNTALGDLIANSPRWYYGIVVVDESQEFKNPSANRTNDLLKIIPYTSKRILLSGTPRPQSALDLWSQLYFLDQGARLGNNITNYRDIYFSPFGKNPHGGPIGYCIKSEYHNQLINHRISDITISATSSILNLPPYINHYVYHKMTPRMEKTYKRLLTNKVLPEHDIKAVNAGVLSNKLAQLANGALYLAPTNSNGELIKTTKNKPVTKRKESDVLYFHYSKAKTVRKLIETLSGNSIVTYTYQSDLCQLKNILSDKEYTVFDGSLAMQKDWNEGKIKILLLQPKSFKHGINIQYGGTNLIWYTIPYSSEEYRQTIARLYRKGQRDIVHIYHLVMDNTVDIKKLNKLKNRIKDEDTYLDLINYVSKGGES